MTTKCEQLSLFEVTNTYEIKKTNKKINFGIYKRLNIKSINRINYLTNKNYTSLWGRFHQMAEFIYANNNWSWEDYLWAAEELYPYLGFISEAVQNNPLHVSMIKKVEILTADKIKELGLFAGESSKYEFALKFIPKDASYKTHYLVLTSDTKKLQSVGVPFSYSKHRNYNFTYISKSLLIGYAKLIHDLIQKYDIYQSANDDEVRGSDTSLWRLLSGLVGGIRSVSYLKYKNAVYETPKISKETFQIAKLLSQRLGRHFKNLNSGHNTVEFVKAYMSQVEKEILEEHELKVMYQF